MIITKNSTTPEALKETFAITQSMFRVAAIQMASGPNVAANLQEAGRLIELAARYDKIHLFGFEMGQECYSEERTIEPGNRVVTVESPYGRIGVSVCYDLRFPELYRAMGEVDLILVPSAFTETTGKAHWDTLIRARAIENLAYVIAPAQGGYHVNGRETHGHTMIVDPWGVVLDRLPRGSGVVVAGVNPTYQAKIRRSLPALTHKTVRSW